MSTKKNIEFHAGETWVLIFTAHNADGTSINLDGTTSTRLRINKGAAVLLTKSVGDGIIIADAAAGRASITITPADQVAAGLLKNKTYSYEIQVTTTLFLSVQCEGQLKVLPSLFGP
jgi:hypothetical protein